MMSNSTLPLGFLHIITDRLALKELAVSLYFDVSLGVALGYAALLAKNFEMPLV